MVLTEYNQQGARSWNIFYKDIYIRQFRVDLCVCVSPWQTSCFFILWFLCSLTLNQVRDWAQGREVQSLSKYVTIFPWRLYSHFVAAYSKSKFQVLDKKKADMKPWIFPAKAMSGRYFNKWVIIECNQLILCLWNASPTILWLLYL